MSEREREELPAAAVRWWRRCGPAAEAAAAVAVETRVAAAAPPIAIRQCCDRVVVPRGRRTVPEQVAPAEAITRAIGRRRRRRRREAEVYVIPLLHAAECSLSPRVVSHDCAGVR